jgi:starch-binding outer membrane protein, SusD/RagB family
MKYYIYLFLLFSGILFTSCSDFLKEYSQDTDYVSSWEDLNETLIGDCYMPVKQTENLYNTTDNQYFIHFMGDELQECVEGYNDDIDYDGKGKVFGYFTWQKRTGQDETYTGYNTENDNWTEIYRLINVANNIIYSDKTVPNSTDAEKIGVLKVDGEAHFLRAYYYFWLVNLYGKPYNASTASTDLGVPLKLSEKVEDKIFQRNTVQEIYDQILSDLNQAESDLSQTGTQSSIYRADVTVVRFLLSRVYLYMQNWEKAAEYAQEVIDVHPDLVDLNALSSTGSFLSKSSYETIFSMGGNSLPCIISYKDKGFQISDDLYNSFDDHDLRKTKLFWHYANFTGYTKLAPEGDIINSSEASYYLDAYNSAWENSYSEVSDKFLFRSAEAYLIKAEADAYLNKEDEARSLLNTLRANRYVDNYQVTASGKDLVEIIRDERRKELALEGQRWFDLRRYGVCEKYPESKQITHDYYYYINRNSTVKTECHTFVLESNDKAYVLPIPQEVINFNTGMINNERPARTYTVTKINE